jgi:hypothetical protein
MQFAIQDMIKLLKKLDGDITLYRNSRKESKAA